MHYQKQNGFRHKNDYTRCEEIKDILPEENKTKQNNDKNIRTKENIWAVKI